MLWDWMADFHVTVLRLRNLGTEMHLRLRVSDLVIPVSLVGEGIEQKYVSLGRGPCWRPKLETIWEKEKVIFYH